MIQTQARNLIVQITATLVFGSLPFQVGRASAEDDALGSRKAWEPPTAEVVQAWLTQIQREVGYATESAGDLEASTTSSQSLDPLSDFCRSLARLSPEYSEIYQVCQLSDPLTPLPVFALLDTESHPPHVRHNLKLLYGRWLGTHMFFDESLHYLQDVPLDGVVDPAALLFYRGIARHHLGMADEAAMDMSLLRTNDQDVPQRFAALSELIVADLKATESHRLDPVARLMGRVQVRLGHARAGRRVRNEEQEVIKKLDDLIKEIEDKIQQQQAAAAAANASRNNAPSAPAEESLPAGARGVGDVTPRNFAPGDAWGNLPPKERERALQQLSKEFPSHYREIVEQYFRKLAQDDQ